jgi:tetratricopeptide (TPR) repeat protein
LEDDFALAWEVLDIARLIFSKDEANKFLEAEALQEIGDLSMETENFNNAVSDYGKALELLVACDAALRELASINFKLGIALEFEGRDLGEACAAYEHAKEHLQNYLAKGVNEDETEEVQTLIQEVENKLTELKNGNVGSIKDALLDAAKQVSPSAFPSDANPVNDISGLVKKRRHEDTAQASQEDGPSKQSKTADDN